MESAGGVGLPLLLALFWLDDEEEEDADVLALRCGGCVCCALLLALEVVEAVEGVEAVILAELAAALEAAGEGFW